MCVTCFLGTNWFHKVGIRRKKDTVSSRAAQLWYASLHIAENCLNFNKLNSMYHPFTLGGMVANGMEPYCPRWPLPTGTLVAEVINE